jgi:hypothetical protein
MYGNTHNIANAIGEGLEATAEVTVVPVEDAGAELVRSADLLAEIDGELVVVDYKTDAARSEAEIDAAVARYEPQGAAYALALELLLGRPVARCVFVFARSRGTAVERETTDLTARVAEVRRAFEPGPSEPETLSLF